MVIFSITTNFQQPPAPLLSLRRDPPSQCLQNLFQPRGLIHKQAAEQGAALRRDNGFELWGQGFDHRRQDVAQEQIGASTLQ